MSLKRSLLAAAVAAFATASVRGSVSGPPSVFNAGVWVQHPGIAVGKLFSSDSRMVAVVGDAHGYLHAWFPNGTEAPGFPKRICDQTYAISQGGVPNDANYLVNSTPALVDIDGDGDLEIFVGSGDGMVYGLRANGTNLPGWPQFTGARQDNHLYGVFSSPAVGDIDGDGVLEVVVGSWSHDIYVWNIDGTLQPGWPFNNTDTVWSSPALADFDRDGFLEIAIGGDWTEEADPVDGGGGFLRLLRYDGTEMPGWPKYLEQVVWSSPAIGDVNNDGELDIIVGTGNFYYNRPQRVHGFDWTGTTLPGWPVTLGPASPSSRFGIFGSPALADLEGDGPLEVFVGDMESRLYCINSNGSIRWNSPVGWDPASFRLFSSPAVGDIDGDGDLEVVIGGGWHISAFNAHNGAYEAGYPIETGYPDLGGTPMFTWSSPTIADLDGDGRIELLIGTGRDNLTGWPDAGGVRVYHESGLSVPPGATDIGPTGVAWSVAPWPRFRRSNVGTGSTNDQPGHLGGNEALIVDTATGVPTFSPNGDGIHDVLSLLYTLLDGDTISLQVIDHSGANVRTLLNQVVQAAGPQVVNWDGRNAQGNIANDGMYRFRVWGIRAMVAHQSFGLNNTVPEVSKSWYLAEGSTVGFEAYVLVQNPNPTPTKVDVTFYKQDGTTKAYSEVVSARTRTTVPIHREVPNYYSVSTRVAADQPIIVERAMYFAKDDGAGHTRAGHDGIGSTTTSRNWYFPANRTYPGDEDFILVTNTEASSITVTATYYFDNQAPVVQNHGVGPTSRYTIPVHGYFSSIRVSVVLQATRPIAAERAFYFDGRMGGSAGIGAVSPSHTWYFAEGDTFHTTYLEMFNPTPNAAAVTVNYMLENGTVIARQYALPAERRLTVNAASDVAPNQRFSIEVLSSRPIVAERVMFSSHDCGDSIGSPTTALAWNLAEGFTAFGYQTWVLVSNPGDQPANVTARLMLQSGDNIVENYLLQPRSRLTLYLNDIILAHYPGSVGASVSTQISSDQPIVVERTMKFDSGRGMHQALGVRQ
jgi:hypothetical protein